MCLTVTVTGSGAAFNIFDTEKSGMTLKLGLGSLQVTGNAVTKYSRYDLLLVVYNNFTSIRTVQQQ